MWHDSSAGQQCSGGFWRSSCMVRPWQRPPSSIADFEFQPPNEVIRLGDGVNWTNEGDAPHTTTSSDETPDGTPGIEWEFGHPAAGTVLQLAVHRSRNLPLLGPVTSQPAPVFVQKRDRGGMFEYWRFMVKRGTVFRPNAPGTYSFRARLVRPQGGIIIGSSMWPLDRMDGAVATRDCSSESGYAC